MEPHKHLKTPNDANRLGLLYQHEATRLPWQGRIWDIHTHLHGLEAAELYFHVADLFNIQRTWTMTPLRMVDELMQTYGHRLRLIAVPDYTQSDRSDTFTTQWLADIEAFAQRGCRMCKFWAAPRGRDFGDHLQLDAPIRLEAMRLARDVGMTTFMTHVADPDTWFATHYRDHRKYGTKAQQYTPLRRVLEMFNDVNWIAAHVAGDPEHLDHVQRLLDEYPHLHVDLAATKWMVRELGRQPQAFAAFCRRNPGRVLFGSDIVATSANMDFDLYASRYWALRALLETDYDGPSPIVDPDLSLIDPQTDPKSTATMHGAALDAATLDMIYQQAAQRLLGG